MKKICAIFIVVIALILVPTITAKIYMGTNRAEATKMKQLSDDQLTKTMISPHMEQQIQENANIVYCSTFQLCWNEMKVFMNGDIELSDDLETVTALNKSLSTKDDISENSYVAVAGLIKDHIEDTINNQLEAKFAHPELVDFQGCDDEDIIAYSYLYKNLKFDEEFESLDDPIQFNEGDAYVKVNAFGIKDYSDKNSEMGKQVDLIDYNNEDDFIIRLKTKVANDEIILAKVQPGSTLLETIESVDKRILNGSKEALVENDALMIPKFSFKLAHSYSELTDQTIMNQAFSDYRIVKALQDITFVLDERGAVLESRAIMVTSKSVEESRHLVFDQPFLLYMKEAGAKYPYFAIWVDNTELMDQN